MKKLLAEAGLTTAFKVQLEVFAAEVLFPLPVPGETWEGER